MMTASLETKAEPDNLDGVSIIVPTYKEVDSLPDLLNRLQLLRTTFQESEVIIVDDNSGDGTEDLIRNLKLDPWVRLIIRRSDRGLSSAVIEGCRLAKFSTLIVMDADLSHPPEAIPAMVKTLNNAGTEFVIGSRYCEGGKVVEGWTLFRRINSWVATAFARPFTNASDPMSGFLAFRKTDFLKSASLNPIGYKIGLELIVKCGFKNVKEVPITFELRKKGESKLSLKEQLKYLTHIKRLADYKFGNFSFLLQFATIGVTGLLINEIVVTILDRLHLPDQLVFSLGILIGMVGTFILNRKITFDHGVQEGWVRQYFKFVAACSFGAFINYEASLNFARFFHHVFAVKQISVMVGAVSGMISNFLLSRYVVFKKNLVIARKK
ncbi:MAG: arnC 3 [Bacteriovoracaceae bacterium]|nr:arnC 3 [Bacteriovoracaceae bacterium]